MLIFSYHLDDAFTLGNSVRACSRFRALATRLLVHSIQWKSYDTAWANLDFWDDNPNLLSFPRKLTLAVDMELRRQSSIFSPCHHDAECSLDQPLTQIFQRIHTFQMLEEASFDFHSSLPTDFLGCIALLPRLKSLRLDNCHLGPVLNHGIHQSYSYVRHYDNLGSRSSDYPCSRPSPVSNWIGYFSRPHISILFQFM